MKRKKKKEYEIPDEFFAEIKKKENETWAQIDDDTYYNIIAYYGAYMAIVAEFDVETKRVLIIEANEVCEDVYREFKDAAFSYEKRQEMH